LLSVWALGATPLEAQVGQGGASPKNDAPFTLARFRPHPPEGDAPLPVRFVDRSLGGVTSWRWDFGDGTTSTAREPVHVYAEGGVYDVSLTVRGPHGPDSVTRPGAVTVRRCAPGNARTNRVTPLERGEDFVPVTGDDSAGFYCVYSGKAVGPGNPGIANNVAIFVLPLVGGEVLLFGAGYGDANSMVVPTESAEHDARRVDALLRFCLGRTPETTPIRFVAPHGHIDHINADFIRELRARDYPIVDIAFHSADGTSVRNLPGWTQADRTLFRTLRSGTGQCQEELLSFASPLGRIWFHLRDGHTAGSIDLVIDVQNDPDNRFVVRGSGGDFGACAIPGVREAIEPHGNLILSAPEPRLASASPPHASALGGTLVTLFGSGFAASRAGTPRVLVDGVAAGSVTVEADDRLTCLIPPGIPGDSVEIRLTNRNGAAVLPNGLRYRDLPTLGSLSPARGLASGGTVVTLTGSGFRDFAPGTNTITFDALPASAVQVLDDNRLTCASPPHAASLVAVRVSNANGSAELSAAFRYDPLIDVTGVTPAQGSARGGTRVQVQGTAFAIGTRVPDVFFGALPATDVVRVSNTRLDCTTPGGPGGTQVDLRVSGENGTDVLAAGYRYFAEPRLTALTPASGPAAGGELVTLAGANFTKNNAGPNQVSFGGTPASGVVTLSDTAITCRVPPGLAGAAVEVRVDNANGTARLPQGYRYHRAPTLASLQPTQGSKNGGTPVTLHGAGFLETGGGTPVVRFGGLPASAVSVLDDGTLTCSTPPLGSEGAVDVTLVNANGAASLAQAFRYVTRPVLTSLAPTSGPAHGGTLVTLHGSGFLTSGVGGAAVFFGRAAAENVRVLDDATLECRTPLALPDTRVDVRLTTANGTARLVDGFRILPLPGLARVTPESGPVSGGTLARLTGRGFDGGGLPPRVYFGGRLATAVVVLGPEELECVTPAAPRGLVDVRVETVGGNALLPGAWVFGSTRPTLGGLTPDHGPSAGGNTIELSGSNFVSLSAGTNTVFFGGVPASHVVALNDERLRCRVPPGAPGTSVDVRLTNGNGTVTRAAAYSYHSRPTLTGLTPDFGSPLGGTLVTLHGSGFVSEQNEGHAVQIGGALASELVVLDDGRISCRTPSGPPGALVEVLLSSVNGQVALPNSFRYQAAPTLVGLAPQAGSPLGGTPLVLSGGGFALAGAGATHVRIGGAPATSVVVLDEAHVSCLSPAIPSGALHDVVLENDNGSAFLSSAFRTYAAPVISSATPASGPAAGGTTVLLLGSGFRSDVLGPNAVTFGGLAARSVTTVDDTRVRAVSPTGVAGSTVELVLRNSNGSALASGGFRFHAEPVLTGCEPPRASALGGAAITLRGSGFQRDSPGPTSVFFGATLAGGVAVLDDETLTCLAPPGPEGGTASVSLSNRNGTALSPTPFQYNPSPLLELLTPAHGFSGGGTRVELTGSGFLAHDPGPPLVWFGALRATNVQVSSDTRLLCDTPPGSTGSVEVRLENVNGSAPLLDGYYYDWAPTLLSLAPGEGTSLGGTLVTLTGGGFATPGAGALAVRFGASPALNVRVLDGGRLECLAPAGPAGTTVSVTVTNTHGSATLTGYQYHARPTLTHLDPPNGPPEGGDLVTLHGTGFSASGAGVPLVRFGATTAAGVTVLDDSRVRCTAPAGAARTAADVSLSNANGAAVLADGYRWVVREATDFNADGISEAVVSATDGVYVYFGSALGPLDETAATADLVLRASSAGTDFGAQLASGDLNGDRFPDLVVGAPLDDGGGTDAGAVFVFFGPLAPSPSVRFSSTANATFRGAAAGDRFGSCLALGDVGGDALVDLTVGAPLNDAAGGEGGAVYVYRGAVNFAGQTTAQASVRLLANGSQNSFGAALAASDVSGDGRADVLVGAPQEGATGGNSGAVYLFRGGPTLTSRNASAAEVQISGANSGDRFGSSLAAADFDGDGTADLFAGAPEAKNQGTQAGSVFAFRGGAGLVSGGAGSAAARYDGESAGDRLGQSLALGDADGDGRADLLVGAPLFDLPSSNSGRAYLVLGGAYLSGSIALRADTVIVAEASAGDQLGAGLALVDLDGDGRSELLLGAPFSNGGGTDTGRVYVFLGSALLATRSAGADDATLGGTGASQLFGRELANTR
jgi:PKD repeat protein